MSWSFTEGELTCVRCLEPRPGGEVDRLLWCDECKEAARQRAAAWGWGVGAVVAASLAAVVWGIIEPEVIVGGWVAAVLAAFYLVARASREIIYGVMRIRNRPAVEAEPADPADSEPEDGRSPDAG